MTGNGHVRFGGGPPQKYCPKPRAATRRRPTQHVFCSLDGFGSYNEGGDWGGYWGKQGPELLERRLAVYRAEQRMVLGANTFRLFAEMLDPAAEGAEAPDPWVARMRSLPLTVVSSTLHGALNWPNAIVAPGDAVDVVARLKEESAVPLRSHGSLSMNRALMAAAWSTASRSPSFRSSPPGPGRTRSSGVEPTSTSS